MALTAMLGFTALIIDVSWYWANTLRVQRAADAAALAGAVQLPGNPTLGATLALSEAKKNGYDSGGVNVAAGKICPASYASGTLQICVHQDSNPYQLDVTVSAPVQTFFIQIFGIRQIQATLDAKAVFQLPVPMGSPENYYGIYCLTNVNDVNCSSPADLVPNADGSGTLASKGFWGAAIARGGNQQNGDAYLPANNGGYSPANNIRYDPTGYSYVVEIPGNGGGKVQIFDPTYCATGDNGHSGRYGTGDHIIDGSAGPVSTYYNLYHFVNPFNAADDGAAIASSGALFQDENQSDHSALYGKNKSSSNDCAAREITDPAKGGYWHNKWWALAQDLAPGRYRLQVTTTDVDRRAPAAPRSPTRARAPA